MAPADPTTVDRLKVGYTGPFGSHTMLFHKKPAADSSAFIDEVREVLTAMTSLMWNLASFLEAFYAVAGSEIFIPLAWTPITSASGVTPSSTSSPARFLQWGGRAIDGRRVKLYLFETHATDVNDMRYQDGEVADIDAVTAILQDEDSTISTISGSAPVWKPYSNVNDNDFLVHKARRA